MNQTRLPQRTWLVAVAAAMVGLIGVSVFSIYPYAEWKASVKPTFFLQDERTEDAIGILESRALKSAFTIYFLLNLGTIPFLVSLLRPKPLWISIVLIGLLLSPMLWYGGKISHVAWKFVDWVQIYPEWFSDDDEAQSVSGNGGLDMSHQRGDDP